MFINKLTVFNLSVKKLNKSNNFRATIINTFAADESARERDQDE